MGVEIFVPIWWPDFDIINLMFSVLVSVSYKIQKLGAFVEFYFVEC